MDAPAVERLRSALRRRLPAQAGGRRRGPVRRRLRGADAWIVRNRTQVRGAAARGAREALRVVGPAGRGARQHRRGRPATARGIEVIPATGANAESVAEYVITAALMLLRGAYFSTARGRSGHLAAADALAGTRGRRARCSGIVGFGSIGRLTARKAAALGMRVVGLRPAGAGAGSPSGRSAASSRCRSRSCSRRATWCRCTCRSPTQTRGLLGARAAGAR